MCLHSSCKSVSEGVSTSKLDCETCYSKDDIKDITKFEGVRFYELNNLVGIDKSNPFSKNKQTNRCDINCQGPYFWKGDILKNTEEDYKKYINQSMIES